MRSRPHCLRVSAALALLPLWLRPAGSQVLCNSSDYQSLTVALPCSGASSITSSVSLINGEKLLGRIPAGLNGFYIQVSSSARMDLKLYDGVTNGCVLGPSCTYTTAGTYSYQGMSLYFGGVVVTLPESETVSIIGSTTRAMNLYAKALGTWTASASYSAGPVSPCPSPAPGCTACSSYPSCRATETPVCDGSRTVVCLQTTTTTTTTTATTTTTSTVTKTTSTTSTTSTKYYIRVPVNGTLLVVFASGTDPCTAAATTALKTAMLAAVIAISSGTAYVIDDIWDVRVAGCARRLLSEGGWLPEEEEAGPWWPQEEELEAGEEAAWADDDGGRRLAGAARLLSYMVNVPGMGNAVQAQALVAAIAANPALFASTFVTGMLAAGFPVNATTASLPVSAMSAPPWPPSLWANDSAATDSCAGVLSPRWRVVGRDATVDWQVFHVGFFTDAACTSPIPVVADRGAKTWRARTFIGRAFGAPSRRAQAVVPADVLEGTTSVPWRSTITCPGLTDLCYLGFAWVTDQSPATGSPPAFSRLPLGRQAAVGPRCVLVNQSAAAGYYASALLVQYWDAAGGSGWRTLTTRAGLLGGPIYLRLPLSR